MIRKPRRWKALTELGTITISPAFGSGEDKNARRTHYQNAHGQSYVYTLCGWDGGGARECNIVDTVDCKDCLAIVAFFESRR